MSKFLTDDNVLRLASAGMAFHSVHSALAPEHFQDMHYTETTARSDPMARWFSLSLGTLTAQTLAPTFGGNTTSKKNALKVVGAGWLAAGTRNAVLTASKHEKRDLNIAKIIGSAALGGLCLYQGFKKEGGSMAATVKK